MCARISLFTQCSNNTYLVFYVSVGTTGAHLLLKLIHNSFCKVGILFILSINPQTLKQCAYTSSLTVAIFIFLIGCCFVCTHTHSEYRLQQHWSERILQLIILLRFCMTASVTCGFLRSCLSHYDIYHLAVSILRLS